VFKCRSSFKFCLLLLWYNVICIKLRKLSADHYQILFSFCKDCLQCRVFLFNNVIMWFRMMYHLPLDLSYNNNHPAHRSMPDVHYHDIFFNNYPPAPLTYYDMDAGQINNRNGQHYNSFFITITSMVFAAKYECWSGFKCKH